MKAISIHIGLNKVDPAHYGSEARLAGCHNDAKDMQKLAKSTGFTPVAPLLDKQATVANVKAALLTAAAALKAGDSFLLTYSGHGSQVPDVSADGVETDHADETWCLYDRMLIDDELASLWAKFKRGVCITVLSDSCHSGTVTRAMPFSPPGAIPSARRSRLLPKECQDYAIKNWELEYQKIQLQLAKKSTILIGASILLISGCRDDETSLDGDANGLFTGTLLQVWNKGAFKGSVKQLQSEIQRRIAHSQNPNYYAIGAVNKTFIAAPALRPVR